MCGPIGCARDRPGRYLADLTLRVNAVASELHGLYRGHASLQGIYHAAELYSTCCYSTQHRCDAAHIKA